MMPDVSYDPTLVVSVLVLARMVRVKFQRPDDSCKSRCSRKRNPAEVDGPRVIAVGENGRIIVPSSGGPFRL